MLIMVNSFVLVGMVNGLYQQTFLRLLEEITFTKCFQSVTTLDPSHSVTWTFNDPHRECQYHFRNDWSLEPMFSQMVTR